MKRRAGVIGLFLLIVAGLIPPVEAAPLPPLRRLYIPYFETDVPWAESSLFWFGKVGAPGSAGTNYADVRVAYTSEGLRLYVNVEDYYLWYAEGATASTPLTEYDAVAIYLDTAHDRAEAPQGDDYLFLSALCLYNCGDRSTYRRQARGTGSGWEASWSAAWDDATWANWWCDPGPNDNACGIDFGWWSYLTLPWSLFGLSGPPPAGTTWGLGVQLFDGDDAPPAGRVPVEAWPESFEADAPATWGEIVFGEPPSAVQRGHIEGTTVIRRGMDGAYVADAWVGGGATCSGGHEGDPDADNHGGDDNLYVESQSLIADFPCFSKSYLRFGLNGIPRGETILSATLTLHQWSNADWTLAQPSLVWLYATEGTWGEYSLTWNNAPPERENLDAVWMQVISPDDGVDWPGLPYTWDATRAVAEAYAAGEPVNFALYTADTNMHSSKYLIASETGDWNAAGRPVLTVTWGVPPVWLRGKIAPGAGKAGARLTTTLELFGDDRPLTLTLPLPAGMGAPTTMEADFGALSYDDAARTLRWTGTLPFTRTAHITTAATIETTRCVALSSTALLTADDGTVRQVALVAIANPQRLYLPIILQRWP